MIEGLDEFERRVKEAETAGVTHIALDRITARALLDAVKASQGPDEGLVIGDLVEVTADHTDVVGDNPYRGRKGTLVNIETLAKNYPYSVEFRLLAGLGTQVVDFAHTELKKVVQ